MRDKEFFLKIIEDWLTYWMNQTQNSKADQENYFRRALGVDANMRHHLADKLAKASDSEKADGK